LDGVDAVAEHERRLAGDEVNGGGLDDGGHEHVFGEMELFAGRPGD
jgi:hypothetical protein